MTQHPALPAFHLEPGTALAQASPWHHAPVTLDSPALQVMTDLTQVKAAHIHPTAGLRQAEQAMIYQGVRMLFVVVDMPAILGLVTATDLSGEGPMRVVHDRGIHHDELRVADVMTSADELDALDFARVKTACVGHLVATLQRHGRNHLLVVQAAGAHHPRRVRGVVSRAQIERQLGEPIAITPIAHSFSEIERALA
jgi:signal-transduction protein with cAMP-binding, CBS, and nucleotidyltransferase domain